MNRTVAGLLLALCLGLPAFGQSTPRESLARAEELFAQGHRFTDEEMSALAELQITLEVQGEPELAADLALLRRAAAWPISPPASGTLAPFEDPSWEWELRDKRQRERDFWLGVRNLGLATFVLSSTSTMVLAWTLDRNEALVNYGVWDDDLDREATMDRLRWALVASMGTSFLSLFPLLWGEARQ